MIAILIIAGIILAFVCYLLFIPVFFTLSYSIERHKFEKSEFKFFPLHINLKKSVKKEKAKAEKSQKEKKKAAKPKRRKSRISYIRLAQEEYGTFAQLLVNAARLMIGVLRSPDVFPLEINLEGGLAEPDLTGWLYGAFCALNPTLGRYIVLKFKPDFNARSLEGNVTGKIKLRIYNLVKELLLFVWRLPKLRLIKIYLKIKRGGGRGRQINRTAVIDYERA
jgi:hypothetical protein